MDGLKLQKNLSPLNVWALALGCIIGWGAFVMPGDLFLTHTGPLGTAIAIGIAALLMINISLNYAFMINKFPVSGGEFFYTKRVFGEKHAFLCSWFLILTYLTAIPLNATALGFIGKNLITSLGDWGPQYSVAEYNVCMGEILLSVCAIILFAGLSIRGVRFAGMFQTILIFALIFGILVITGAAILSPRASFHNLYPYFRPDTGKIEGMLIVLTVAPWAFAGFDTIPQAAEELAFSHRKTKILMILAILFGAGVYITLNTVTAMTVPEKYTSWVSYIDSVHTQTGIMALPTFYSANVLLGKTGVLLLAVSVFSAILSGIVGFYMATSRLIYSMANESVLPKWFGQLHPKFSTPHHAIIFIAAVSIFAPFIGRTALGWIVDMSSTGAAIGYFYTSLAAFLYGRKQKNCMVTITGAIGVITGVIFVGLLLIPIPMLGCSLSMESYICFFIWIVMGGIFYYHSHHRQR